MKTWVKAHDRFLAPKMKIPLSPFRKGEIDPQAS
jgi:hypothetical protein